MRNTAVVGLRFTVKSIDVLQRKGNSDRVELSLHYLTAPKSPARLVLPKEDAEKMNARIGSTIVARIKSTDHEMTQDLESTPELAKLHWFRITAKITSMQRGWSEPTVFGRWWQPYAYFDTTFQYEGDDGLAMLPLESQYASRPEISVGDPIRLSVTTPIL